jgi:hypothetical protein
VTISSKSEGEVGTRPRERNNSPYGQSEEQRTHKEKKTEKRGRSTQKGTISVCIDVQKASDVTTV